jgi:hypothetical protein
MCGASSSAKGDLFIITLVDYDLDRTQGDRMDGVTYNKHWLGYSEVQLVQNIMMGSL